MKKRIGTRCGLSVLLMALMSIVLVTAAQAQTGLQFNGSSQYVTFGTATALDAANFTLECWFKRTATGATTSTGTGGVTAVPLVTKGRGEGETPANLNMNYFLGIDGSSRLAADFEEGSGPNHPITGTTTIALNTWYHAAVTYDVASGSMRLYLNGVLENSLALTPGISPASTCIQHGGIGTAMTSTGVAAGYFAGVIDEVRIWNYARSEQSLADSMNVEIPDPVAGLLGRWGLNEGSGASALNSVSGNPNGILTNSPTWVSGNPGFPVPPPGAPTGLAVSAISFGQNHVTWTDNSSNESGFEIDRSTTGVGGTYALVATVPANTTAYEDLNLNGSAEYCYRVRATNSGGASDYCTPQCGITPAEGNYALQLDGTSAYATFGQATTALGVQSFTLECWFKRAGAGSTTTSGTDGILAVPLVTKGMAEADGTTADMNFFLGINGPTFVSGRSYGPANVLSADFEEGTGTSTPGLNHPVAGVTSIADNVWYHAAVTFDAASRRWQLFLNGNLEKDTVIASGTRFPQFNSTQHAAIGSALQSNGLPGTSAGYGPGYFNGTLDEVRVWNYARTQSDIQSTINLQIAAPQSGLIARWGLNEGTGSVVNAGAGSAAAGTIMGSGSVWQTPGAPFNLSYDPPAPPTGLSALALSSSRVQLQWTDNSDNEANFEIERSTTGSGGPFTLRATVGAGVVTYTDTNLTPEAQYCYRVRATNGAGPSEYASPACATTTSAPNMGLHFGGTNGYVNFGTAPTLNTPTFTLETWFKREGAGVSNTTGTGGVTAVPLIAKGAAESENTAVDINYFLGIHDGDNALCVDFEEGAGGTSPSLNHPLVGTTAIVTGTWYHAAATYDGTTLKLYLNGNLESQLAVGQPVASAGTSSLAALATSLRSNGTAQGYFNGTLDEVRIWNSARTQAEINATINEQIAGSQPGLLARWALDEGSGSSVNGSAGTTVNGTVGGSDFNWVSGAPFNIAPNQPPDGPVLVAPANGGTQVSFSPTLDVTVTDPEAQNLTVTFYGRTFSASPGVDFSIVALPDAQFYTAQTTGSNATFKQQAQWIVDNRTIDNIAFVSQLGDITNDGDNDILEWRRADTTMSILEAANPVIPYGIAMGNHDQITGTSYYNQFFGTARFSGRPYYGGHFGANNNSHFEFFSAGSNDFIVINLENGASASAIHWADSLMKAHASRRAILVNHTLLANASNPASFSSTGQAIYDSLKDNANLFLMLCGHVDGEGQREDTYNGHTVYSLLSDYQGRSNGGDGWLRVLQFSPANNEILVRTYSPKLDQFETDPNSQFTLAYAMSTTSSFSEIGTVSVPSGSHATVTWPGLASGTQYEWYVTISDGNALTTGPAWNFTTVFGSATSLTSSANPSLPGQAVAFTATVTPSAASGTVQFAIDAVNFGLPVTLASGTATSDPVSTLTEATHQVTATYSGDATYLGSVSPIFNQVVSSVPVQYTLTTATIGNGTVSLNPPGGTYDPGTVITVTANAGPGWGFSAWSGDLTGSVNPTTITMDGNKAVTATFVDQGLVGHWRFDENSGTTAHDASGHGLDGTVNGATWTTGQLGGGLEFNGSSNYVDLGNPALLQITGSMTWCAWVRASADPGDDGQIIAKSDVSGWQLKTSPDTGPQRFGIAISSGAGSLTQRYSATVRSLNTWYHVAGVYDASARTLNIYVNGLPDNGTLSGTVPASQYVPDVNVNIGRRSGGYYFAGTIDDARIYSRALTQQEIQGLMVSGPRQYFLTVHTLGSGTVTRTPGLAQYDSAQVVTLTAIPADGWQFIGWSGDMTGTANPSDITMTSDKVVTATFSALPGSETISFVSYGDFGDGGTNATNVANLIKSLNPGIILTNGDNNYSGDGSTAGWDNVVGKFYGQQYIHYPEGSTSAYAPGPAENAFFPSIGNHDMDLGVANQAAYFDLPPNERYYTFVKGPVQFFAIDSDTREPDGASSTSTQALWLQAQLAASTAPWKVVYMHESPYSSCTTHGSIAHMQWPFEQWGADAVISAHDHVYERIVRDENADGKNIVYIITGAGGHGLYNFGTPVSGSQFRYNASYGATFVEATTTSLSFKFYSLASPNTPVDSYISLKQTTGGLYVEDFNAFTIDQTVGSHAGWFDGTPTSGPVVRSGNGAPNSGGQATQGLDVSGTIFTWADHPFIWNDVTLQEVIFGMDFKSDANGQFDDDRVCWNINQSTDSRYNFGVQLDNASGVYAVTTYWRGNIANDVPRIQDPIVSLTGIQPNAWYRLRATIKKLTAGSARIDVMVYGLNANGDSTGAAITGSIPNTSEWSGGAPDPNYFTAGAMWPAYKNHTGAPGPSDNAYARFVTGTPTQFPLTVNIVGGGTVTLSPAGGTYDSSTVVTATAVSAGNWVFSHWSGDLSGNTNPATITMNGPKSVSATFVDLAQSLTVWKSDLVVSEGLDAQTLTFGHAISATDGIDTVLGEQRLPPPPPTGLFDARFNLPVVPASSSWKDFRDSADTHSEWTISFQRAVDGAQVAFAWDTTALLNAGGRYLLKDPIDGSLVNVNMRTQASFVLDIPGMSTLMIVHDKIFCSEVSVDSGWNMLSVPLVTADMAVSVLFPGATSQAYGYHAGYVVDTVMESKQGYWLEFHDPGTFTFCGSLPVPNEIAVTTGWNMIGPLIGEVPTSGITTTPPGIINSPFYGFEHGYVVPTSLVPGKGYWVSVSEPGSLHLAGGGVAKVSAVASQLDPTWPRLKFTDSRGGTREIVLAVADTLKGNYVLPPVPPAGIFDVRFKSNTNVERIGKGTYEVDLSSTSYPIRLEGSNLGARRFHVEDAINGTILSADLVEGRPVSVTRGLTRIVLRDMNAPVNLPREFALGQNYPNPFNPATTIQFALPVPSRVTITVFDLLGAKVADLVDADYEAGYHHVAFDAQSYSSGIYFYRISAGKFTAVKKMMVLK